MPQLKNPVTGAVVTVATGNEAPYTSLGWTVTNQASSAGFNGSGVAASGTGLQPGNGAAPKAGNITTDSLKIAEPINLGAIETDTTDESGAMVAGAGQTVKSLADYIKELTPAETAADTQKSSLDTEIAGLYQQLESKGTDQIAAEESSGATQLKKDYADVNAQILTKTAEYEALSKAYENQGLGKSNVTGRQNQIQRAKASEVGLLQARALGLQGQVTAAQDAADRAIDLKYSTIEAQIKTKEVQLNAIKEILNKEEAIEAEALQRMYDDQKTAIAEQKATEKEIQAISLQILQNGGDSALANQISNAKTTVEAMQIAGELANSNGWKYVSTIAERDKLIKAGYELTQSGGRTYARPSQATYTTKNITVGSGKTSKDYIITYDSLGKEVKRELLSGGSGAVSNTTQKVSSTEALNSAVNDMSSQLKTVVGSDGFISPDNYTAARNAWIAEGLSPTTFDTKFKGFRNPNNPNYVTNKQSNTNDRDV